MKNNRPHIKSIFYFLTNYLWMLLCWGQARLFKESIKHVEKTQRDLLFKILRNNQKTKFGKGHNFKSISNISDFKSAVPISIYADYSSYIDSISRGEKNVLTKEPVLILEPSSGSTTSSKYIPYTYGLRREFQNGIKPWMFDLFVHRKKLLLGNAYWSITPVSQDQKAKQKISVGFKDDNEYFGTLERYLLNRMIAVPKEVCKIKDITAFRYITLFFLLKNNDLSFISVWNPTFLTLLLEPTMKWSDSLINDIRNGTINPPDGIDEELKAGLVKKMRVDGKRAKELTGIFQQWRGRTKLDFNGTSLYEDIWPNLSLISCWADGTAARYLKEVKTLFPNIEIQPKGIIATEGFISFPLIGESGAALSISSHFFEFLEDGTEQDTKLAHQLEKNKRYSVIITTSGGLYRYRLHDLVEVVGFKKRCPLIRFLGKEDKIVDLFGEKLNEYHVSSLINEVFERHSLSPRFYMIAPEKDADDGHYFYTLFIKFPKGKLNFHLLQSLAEEIEAKLHENYHYQYCRKLGQLSELGIFVIDYNSDPIEDYLYTCRASGQKLGDIKPNILHSMVGWSKVFRGNFLQKCFSC